MQKGGETKSVPWGSTVRAPPAILHGGCLAYKCKYDNRLVVLSSKGVVVLMQDTVSQSLAKTRQKGLIFGALVDQTSSVNSKASICCKTSTKAVARALSQGQI